VRLAGGVAGVLIVWAAAASVVAPRAAELPTMKPAPAAPLKKCNIGGMEGVVIAGSSACVKIGGYVSGGVEVGNVKP
jgi:hypothetical protein